MGCRARFGAVSRTSIAAARSTEMLAAAGVEPDRSARRGLPRLVGSAHLHRPGRGRRAAGAARARSIKIGVLSNTIWPRAEHERIFARDGLTELIDAAVYTSEIEWTKPHPEAFRAILAALGVADPAARRIRR